MTVYEKHRISVCPVEDIAAYIDGELNDVRETEIEEHFAACERCSLELNLQKQFLCDVSSGLRQEDAIDLPSDFAKKIAVKAESTVSGLRRPRERFNALFICAGLALFALFALGTEAGNFLNLAYGLLEQIAAVGSFFGQLVYSFFLGVAIVLRTFAARAGFEMLAAVVFAIICVAATLRFRRRVLRLLRV
jgi:hypothetical protein